MNSEGVIIRDARDVLIGKCIKLRWRINKSFPKLVDMLKDREKVADTKAEAHGDFNSVNMVASTEFRRNSSQKVDSTADNLERGCPSLQAPDAAYTGWFLPIGWRCLAIMLHFRPRHRFAWTRTFFVLGFGLG